MLKPALARGELHCVGATTLNEYREYIEKDAALERRFQKVLVDEPNEEDTIAILRGLRERYEVHHGVTITDSAIIAATKLSQRYIEDYANDLKSLNVLPATSNPQVSKTMPLIIQFIEGLIQKGHAYAASNGDVYFRVTSDDDYGRLSGRRLDEMQRTASKNNNRA